MNPQDLSTAKNPVQRASFAALLRAGELARKEAIAADTDIVVVQDGKIVIIPAQTLREEAAKKAAQSLDQLHQP